MFSQKYKDHFSKTLTLALPVCVSQLGHMFVGVADAAFVGQIGPNEQAAVSLSGSLYVLVLVFGLGISMGVTPLVAEADVEKDILKNSGLLKNGLLVNVFVSIALFLLLFFVSPVLRHFDQPPEVVELAVPFLNVMIFSMVPLALFSTFKQFAEGLSFTRAAMVISLSANLLNILLNYLLVFGHWGFPEMGMMGSCWASFIARCIMAAAMFLFVYFNHDFKPYWHKFNEVKSSWEISKKILSIGVPSGLQWVFEIGAFSFAVLMIGWIGAKQQAAHLIALSLAAITYMIASGLSAAVAVRVGNYLGLKDRDGMRVAGFSAFVMVLCFMFLSAITFIVLRNVLPQFFSKESEVISIASSLLVIAALFQLWDGMQVVALGALRGLKDTVWPTVITLIAYWAIGLPLSYLLAFKLNMGIHGIWWGLSSGLFAAALLLFLRFNFVSRTIA